MKYLYKVFNNGNIKYKCYFISQVPWETDLEMEVCREVAHRGVLLGTAP